jgi:hypothetical protein
VVTGLNNNKLSRPLKGALLFLALLLLTCGDIEMNPGPGDAEFYRQPQQDHYAYNATEPFRDRDWQRQRNSSELNQIQSLMAHTLNQAVSRLEASTQQQGKNIEEQLKKVETKIVRRLQDIEENQKELHNDIEWLRSQCDNLNTENKGLKKNIDYLNEKCDYLENQSKRNNLVFFGFPPVRSFETWQESEEKVKDVLVNGLGFNESIQIERAYRAGKTIVTQFSSYKQKMAILSCAKELKNVSRFKHIFIGEDFSQTVQEKRRGLRSLQRELWQKGYTAKLRYDKLVTRTAAFTYDLETQEYIRLDKRNQPNAGRTSNLPSRGAQLNPPQTSQHTSASQSEGSADWRAEHGS